MPVVFSGDPLTGTSNNDILLGISSTRPATIIAGDGNDVVYGDFGYFNTIPYRSSATAALDANITNDGNFGLYWTRQFNRDIANSNTVSHMTIVPDRLTGAQGWVALTVVAGQTITLDVDYGRDTNNEDTDTVLRIYNSAATTVLAENDDGALDVGSASTRDSNLVYTFTTAGTYFINISEYDNPGSLDGGVFEANDEFMLHVSLTDRAFVADPEAIDSVINGGAGDDTLYGFGGNDQLNGGLGADVLDGGSGRDLASYLNSTTSIYARLDGVAGVSGEAIGDVYIGIEGFIGSVFNDVLVGGNGANAIDGFDGDDQIYGLAGADELYGGTGKDILYGGADADSLFGGEDSDNLYGGAGGDTFDGGNGFDYVRYDTTTSGVYARMDGVAGSYGEAAGDAFSLIECLIGSAFDDIFVGSDNGGNLSGTEYLLGQGGNDRLYGLGGADNLQGGIGNDNLYGGAGADALNGGIGFDLARYESAASGVYVRLDGVAGANGEAAGDTFISIEGLVGSGLGDIIVGSGNADYLFGLGGDDYIYGIGGEDNLNGGAGNDQLYGGVAGDVLNGGDGFDLARYDSATAAVYARLDGVAGQGGEALGDSFISIQGLVGSAFNDIFAGSNNVDYLKGLGGDDTLYGLGGNDILIGDGGNDTLYGGAGNDTLTSGLGNDRFVFTTALGAFNVDKITDFNVITDDFMLSQAIFAGIGATLDASEFQIGNANSSTDRIIHDNVSGELYYDADGNGSGFAILFAMVTPGTPLNTSDFIMVA